MTYTSYFEHKTQSDALNKIINIQTKLKNKLISQNQYMQKIASILREFEIANKQNQQNKEIVCEKNDSNQ